MPLARMEVYMAVSVWWDRVATAEEHVQVLRALDLDETFVGG